jgi:NAD(P)-dependent dehydrogenase (short-subunit alcohol dehydrogenase family)
MAIDLNAARVLVIGGSSGIGRAAARMFGEHGAKVTIASREGARLTTAGEELGVRAVPLDTGDEAAIAAFFSQEMAFDHVVISAAQTKGGPVASLPLDAAKASMESKFWGAYRVARAVRINDGGSLTFVSGFLSRRPSATAVLQGAINAALEALARGLALERAPVRVNTVSPGLIDTPIYAGMADADRQAMFDRTATRLPAGRVGQPDDIASAIVMLASNPFATGTTVTIDGGGTIV